MKKRIIAGSLSSLAVLLLSATVWAEGALQSIQVMMERIHVSVNGQQAHMSKDSILYNGSVYIPLRNMAELLGAEVSWDGNARTVNLDFLKEENIDISRASQKGFYQYITILNNRIMSDLLRALETNNMSAVEDVRNRYAQLEKLTKEMSDNELSISFGKLAAAVELLRGGWQAKNFDDYGVAWVIYNTNATKVNTILKNQITPAQ